MSVGIWDAETQTNRKTTEGGNIISLTRAEYEALEVKNPNILYIVTDGEQTAPDNVIEYGSNENGHYKKWASGLIEQWGEVTYSDTTGAKDFIVNLPISFSETSYVVTIENEYNGTADGYYLSYLKKQNKTVNSFNVRLNPLNSSQHSIGFTWSAKGN